MADLKISALNSLAGADLVAADVVAVVDNSASETKKLTVSDLIANGTTLISDATIPSAKILFSAGSIDTAELAASSVETAKINDSAVTAAKLADNSSVTLVSTLPASGDFIGQIALDTDDNSIVVWSGSAWLSPLASGSINVVNGSTSGIVNITTSTSNGTVTISTSLDDTSAAANFLAGPTGAGGTVGYRAIAGSDLPKATTSTKGAVVVNGNGLTMSNDEIQINNTVTAETTNHHVVQYDANGLITAGRAITGADIPSATSSVKGSVFPGTGLAVTAAGELNHSNNITAGTFTKVTVDTEGHVTATTDLVASDIPDLPATKITTGTLPTERLANEAITADKLANESTTKFIGAGATDNVVTFPDGDFKGQFAYDEKNEDLYVYTGNSFIPITVISGNLVNAGTYNANTNLISSVTTAGSAAGFTSGGSLPTPATTNLNYYVVVDTSGTGSGAAPSVSLAPPDMLVSLGTGATFQLVDVSNAIAGQTAANISVVPVGSVAATDAQAAIQELDTEKLAKAGGTMSGNLELGAGIVIVFEGATANDYETTLTVTDPTADRTITLPDETGTVLTTGASGAVTSAMIADGTIVNADISASAEIAVSKLANGTARQLLQTDSTGAAVEFTSNIDVPGTLDCTGAGTFDSSLTVTGVINADGKVKFPAGTAALPSFYNGTDTNTGLYFSAADEISVSTAGTQRVVVDSSGNVGINRTSPHQALDIGGTTTSLIKFTPSNYGTGATDGAQIGVNFGGLDVWQYESNYLRFGTNNTERIRLDSSGRLLVGTSTASATGEAQYSILQVSGNTSGATGPGVINIKRGQSSQTLSDGTTLGRLVFSAIGGGDSAVIQASVDGSSGASDFPGSLRFLTCADGASSPTERVRIDSSGNVGIGTTANGSSAKFEVRSTTGSISSATSRINAGATTTGAINTGASLLFAGHDGSNERDFASLFAGKENGTSGNHNAYLAFATRVNSGSLTERLRIDSSGRLLQGKTSTKGSTGENIPTYCTEIASNNPNVLEIANNGTGSGSYSALVLSRSDSTSVNGHTAIDSGDKIGEVAFIGADGADRFNTGAAIAAIAQSDFTANDCPTHLTFSTNGGSATASERMRIDSSGRLLIGTTTEGSTSADNLTIADSGHCGMTIRSGSSASASIYFSDTTSGDGEFDGYVQYKHNLRQLVLGAGASTRFTIDSDGVVTVKNGAVAEIDALTDAATITPDLAASCNFSVTLGGNRTLANPSNITAGQSGSIFVSQDSTGSRTLAFGSYWDFAGGTAPTLTTTASAVDRIDYIVRSSTSIHAVATLAYS